MKLLYIILFIFTFYFQICAENIGSSSIEWLTCSSDLIVMGEVENIKLANPSKYITYDLINIKIDKVLKGNIVGRKLSFELQNSDTKTITEKINISETNFIIFLKENDDKKYIPTSLQFPLSIIDLNGLTKNLYNKDGKEVQFPVEIIDLVKKWANVKIAHSLRVEPEVFGNLFPAFIVVPAEEKYREIFLKMARSDNSYERKKAAIELSKFPGDETEKVLRQLLYDETEEISYFAADVIYEVNYSVRAAAFASLKMLGKSLPDIRLKRQPTLDERTLLRQSYWRKSFTETITDEWKVFSVEDGESFEIDGLDRTSVIITLKKDENIVKIILIPKEWDKTYFPQTDYLGINGKNSQGGRHFFLEGNLPKEIQAKLVDYLGLEM